MSALDQVAGQSLGAERDQTLFDRITVEYADTTGDARVTLQWDEGGTWGMVPAAKLRPGASVTEGEGGKAASPKGEGKKQ